MIGIVDVEVQAANPQMPLCPFVAFVGSPSSVRVRNVPGNIGSWNITKVYVSANYPDNSIQSRECTRVGEIYVGTLPACNAVGKGANGFVVSADGVDENGNAVTGYVLGKGDLEILDADGAITPGVTTHYVHGLDEQPSDPHEYDIYKDGDTWKIYFDGAWEPFAAPVTLDNAVTKDSANGVKSSGIWAAIWGALAELPKGVSSLYDWCVAQLAGKASKSDATLTPIYSDTPTYSKWTCKVDGRVVVPESITYDEAGAWTFDFGPDDAPIQIPGDEYSTELTKPIFGDSTFTATRTRTDILGYRLGPDEQTNPNRDKPLASEAEAEALRTGKQNALTAQQLANIAAVPNKANASAIPYSLVTKTISNGAVTLDDRAINAVAVSSSLASLTVNFPTATSGKARDFGLRLTVASGITTAPELALPQGVVCENADGKAPEIGADGAATILYFTETASGVFLVKGEVVTAIS